MHVLLICCHSYSYLIYTLSTERKRQNGQSYDSWLTLVVNDILLKAGIAGIKLSNRLLALFRKKISCLQSAYKRANKAGGRQAAKLVNTWRESTYTIRVHYHETEIGELKKANETLRGEKRNLETALEAELSKRMKVEEDLEVLKKINNKNKIAYKGKFKQLVKKIARLSTTKKSRGPAKNKTFDSYTKQHQTRVKRQLKEQCETALSFLGQYQFAPSRIEMQNMETRKVESFCFSEDDTGPLLADGLDEKAVDEQQISDLNMWLYLKDKFQISNEAWHELAMKSGETPNLYKILKHMRTMNSKWDLKPTPGKAEGVQISFCDSLIENVKHSERKALANMGKL